MNLSEQIKNINWLRILLFYGVILTGTYLARKLPNILNLALEQITDIPFSFNFNHGFVTVIAALVFYKFSKETQAFSLLGDKKLRSLLFPAVLLATYTIYGIPNKHGVNPHIWALTFCCFALVYNIMEEYAWRGYLVESMGKLHFVLRSLISGILWAAWHLLVFSNFNQYGGFAIFLVFCILFSFILTFAVSRTKAIIVPAAIHAFIIQTNIAALICLALFVVLLLTWNKRAVKTAA